MYRLLTTIAVCALVGGGVFLASAVSGETRLFSARTDQPGVTIVEASRNGVALPVGGQNAGATFFRIENPSGAVPCSNQLHFMASDGRAVERTVDLCASNWELTVALGAGTTTAAAPPAKPATQPAATSAATSVSGNQVLTIGTDAPDIKITNVFVGGKELPITARQDPYVQVNLGSAGATCNSDLGVVLSDGRRIARDEDLCASGFVVVIALNGDGAKPPLPTALAHPPTTIQPLPPAQQPAEAETQPEQEQAEQTSPADTGTPAIVSNMQWLFASTAESASFAYGTSGSDASEFTAVCQPHSSKVTITLTRSADELGPDATVPVVFSAGAFTKTYTAKGSPVSDVDGLSHPVLQLAITDPVWAAIIKERVFGITIGASTPYGLSLSGSSAPAKQFLAACSPTPPPPPPLVQTFPRPALPLPGRMQLPPPTNRQVTDSGFVCNDGSSINIAFDSQTAVVYEPGARPVVLYSAPSDQGAMWIAGRSQLVGQGENIYWTRGSFTRTCQRG